MFTTGWLNFKRRVGFMCSVQELTHTLRALDAGKETEAIRECMEDVYYTQQLLREFVAHHPVCRRGEAGHSAGGEAGGVWVTMSTLGGAETPLFMPLGAPFSVWEASESEPHVEMNEYTLAYTSEYAVPAWVHESADFGEIFERWFAGAPAERSALLGSSTLAASALRRGLKCDGVALAPRHFLCVMLRKTVCVKTRVDKRLQRVPVRATVQRVGFTPRQNCKFNFFEDGSRAHPYVMSRWLKVDRKGGPWEAYPLFLPPGHAALSRRPLTQ